MNENVPSDPTEETRQFAGLVNHEDLLTCIHCGLCTSSCPTYLETGNENDSPRGRIHLMRGIEEQRIELTDKARRHLDLCLDCRSCETACPSGVQYGQLIETFRNSQHERDRESPEKHGPSAFESYLLGELFVERHRLERLLWPARLMQWLRLDRLIEATGLIKLMPVILQRMQRMLPRLRPYQKPLPGRLETSQRPPKRRVGLFLGCVADGMFRHQHWATARVLQHAGCDLIVPASQVCCGAIEYHAGETEDALKRAKANLKAFQVSLVDTVVVNVAGCGAMLKEYEHLAQYDPELKDQLDEFSSRVKDVNELLWELEFDSPTGEMPIRIVYQDACHLRHAQQIQKEPRELLRKIPGLEICEIREPNICCGAAGSYNLVEPEMSDRLANRKIDHILEQSPDAIVSGNIGCSMQLQAMLKQRGLDIPVVHPVELLDASIQGQTWHEFRSSDL